MTTKQTAANTKTQSKGQRRSSIRTRSHATFVSGNTADEWTDRYAGGRLTLPFVTASDPKRLRNI